MSKLCVYVCMCMCDLGLVDINYFVCKYCKITHLVYSYFWLLNSLLTPLASSCALSTCKYLLTLCNSFVFCFAYYVLNNL